MTDPYANIRRALAEFEGKNPAFHDILVARLARVCTPDTIRALVEERDALAAALEAAREDAWQPIETAPKDGSEFLSVANYADEPRQVLIVDWDFVQQCQPGLYTHWMPLPEPPEVG